MLLEDVLHCVKLIFISTRLKRCRGEHTRKDTCTTLIELGKVEDIAIESFFSSSGLG